MDLIVLEKKGWRIAAIQRKGVFIDLWVEQLTPTKPVKGDIYLGVVNKVLDGKNAAFVSIGRGKPGLLNGGDTIIAQKSKTVGEEAPTVSACLKEGEAIIVQVKHEGYDRKGPIVTELIQMTGETLVYMPFAGYSAVSKSLSHQRDEYLSFADENCKGYEGVIFRSQARKVTKDEIAFELDDFRREWKSIVENASIAKAPATLHKASGFYEKLNSVFPINKLSRLITNSTEVENELNGKPFDSEKILVTSNHRAFKELEKKVIELNSSTVKVGKATIHIETTRAFTAIDIDTGGADFGSKEQTHKEVNEKAVIKILEQLRLRNISGKIVIDFLPLSTGYQDELTHYIKSKAAEDVRLSVGEFTQFGLFELQRKKQGLPLSKLNLELD